MAEAAFLRITVNSLGFDGRLGINPFDSPRWKNLRVGNAVVVWFWKVGRDRVSSSF